MSHPVFRTLISVSFWGIAAAPLLQGIGERFKALLLRWGTLFIEILLIALFVAGVYYLVRLGLGMGASMWEVYKKTKTITIEQAKEVAKGHFGGMVFTFFAVLLPTGFYVTWDDFQNLVNEFLREIASI